MGEVWRAHDPRLERDVALKVLPARFAENAARLARLQAEAKVLASLNHPHIATLFGLEDSGGLPVLVMELVEGETLSKRLWRDRLPLVEALDLGRQIAEALEAAHEKGILHRDLKPANVRLTEKGRAKLLDFGLARVAVASPGPADSVSAVRTETSPVTGPEQVLGTPSYMSPEQARGEEVDRRTDVWSFGCVLFEMLTGEVAFAGGSYAETVTAVLAKEPDWRALPDATPAAVVSLLKRCLKKNEGERLRDVGDARLELEELLRSWRSGAQVATREEARSPYPGLRSFAEKDAGVFFGREEAVSELWEKLRERRLTAVIGPSGAGKTSFVRAGVCACRPAGWGAVVCSPGARPFTALAAALAVELAGDVEGVTDLIHTDDPWRALSAVGRWRRLHAEALLVIDQFEELFTLNPPDVQTRFSDLLGRIANETDTHVLLSLRDDFLFECSAHASLAAVFADLTPLRPPRGDALRRLLVEPAAREGVAFENEALVDDMLTSVAEERGALPLLAFAASRLWEERDQDRGLLTHAAYARIGGVAGAVARHAEATLARIGPKNEPITREIFRNLVSAQGTRAVRERKDLLSVFGEEQTAAAHVLDALIDARLLTAYEARGARPGRFGRDETAEANLGTPDRGEPGTEDAAGGGGQLVEIIHESLLTAWPRLVRWQTQDAEGAQLRDQLRQAARLWEERGRPDDQLWTGTSYLELRAWRERYTGGLSTTEEAFARATTRHAGRRRRLRRVVAGAVFVALLAGLVTVATLWWDAVRAAQRSEASKLLALGRLELDRDNSQALAYALRSLELADDPVTRRFVLQALWRGPTHLVVRPAWTWDAAFSPDGRRLVRSDFDRDDSIEIWAAAGGAPVVLADGGQSDLAFGAEPDRLVFKRAGDEGVRLRSLPDGATIRSLPSDRSTRIIPAGARRVLALTPAGRSDRGVLFDGATWSLASGESEPLGRFEANELITFSASDSWMAWGQGRTVRVRSLGADGTRVAAVVFEHEEPVALTRIRPDGRQVASYDVSGAVHLAGVGEGTMPGRFLPGAEALSSLDYSPDGATLAGMGIDGAVRLWDLDGPPDADPAVLRQGEAHAGLRARFHPGGRWLVTSAYSSGTAVWPLGGARSVVLRGHGTKLFFADFTPDGRSAISSSLDGTVRVWPLSPEGGQRARVVFDRPLDGVRHFVVHPDGKQLLLGCKSGRVEIVPLAGGRPRLVGSLEDEVMRVAISPDGRLAAAVGGQREPRDAVVRIWDLDTGAERVLDPGLGYWMTGVEFIDDSHLVSGSWGGGLHLWDLRDGSARQLEEGGCGFSRVPGGRVLVRSCVSWAPTQAGVAERPRVRAERPFEGTGPQRFARLDLDTGRTQPLDIDDDGSFWNVWSVDPSGRFIVSGDWLGTIRVAPLDGGPQHVLFGHEGRAWWVQTSPDGRWILSAGDDGTLRLWPWPTGRPFHTLPREELLDRLRALTNLRVVAHEGSPPGYHIEIAPFPGWETMPTW